MGSEKTAAPMVILCLMVMLIAVLGLTTHITSVVYDENLSLIPSFVVGSSLAFISFISHDCNLPGRTREANWRPFLNTTLGASLFQLVLFCLLVFAVIKLRNRVVWIAALFVGGTNLFGSLLLQFSFLNLDRPEPLYGRKAAIYVAIDKKPKTTDEIFEDSGAEFEDWMVDRLEDLEDSGYIKSRDVGEQRVWWNCR